MNKKFRVWDFYNSEMVFFANIWNNKQLSHKASTSPTRMGNILNKIELMQFTGLLDKNGKEIYEGDIVKYISPYENEFLGEVSWNPFNDMAGFQTNNPHINIFNEARIEVIGNIYENPELLKP